MYVSPAINLLSYVLFLLKYMIEAEQKFYFSFWGVFFTTQYNRLKKNEMNGGSHSNFKDIK